MKLSGWGRFRAEECRVVVPRSRAELIEIITHEPSLIARGNGRSYGDAALNRHATLLMNGVNRFVSFDNETGLIKLEAGVLLADVLEVCVPKGWFPLVTPGTKFVTIGGAMACDVHGKNHHRDGSFCESVQNFTLIDGTGTLHQCSRTENETIFQATLGGMGLTGVILDASLQLRPIESAYICQQTDRCDTLQDLFDTIEKRQGEPYSVAWIDCTARGPALGRGVVFSGHHASHDELPDRLKAAPLTFKRRAKRRIPFPVPLDLVRHPLLKTFNALYFALNRPGRKLVDYDTYFYPLDAISDWNRVYGPLGFLQFQCVVPKNGGRDAIRALIHVIAESGTGSPLAVLKHLGPGVGGLSFPIEGYTLALDFPARAATLKLQDRLNAIVASSGGRLYFAKDATASRPTVEHSYDFESFREARRSLSGNERFQSSLSQRIGLT